MIYALMIHENHTVCPVCAGMAKSNFETLDLFCTDCKTVFKCIGEGKADRELLYEGIKVGE